MKHPPLVLDPVARTLVDAVMRDHCHFRMWRLSALAVRSNHVHVVIAEPTIDPETIVKQLKEWGTRKLRDHRIVGPTQRVWADHASTNHLFEHGSFDRAVEYVLHGQDHHEGRPDWQDRLTREP